MAISAQLSRTLHLALGENGAADMVNWMNRVDDQRAELRELNTLSVERLEARFGQLEAQVDTRFAQVDARFAQLEERFSADLRVGMKDLEAKIDRRFADVIKWSFVFWCGLIAAALLAR